MPDEVPVGPYLFRLRVIPGPVLDDCDDWCMYAIDPDEREIVLSGMIPPHLMPIVTAIAVARAWQRL